MICRNIDWISFWISPSDFSCCCCCCCWCCGRREGEEFSFEGGFEEEEGKEGEEVGGGRGFLLEDDDDDEVEDGLLKIWTFWVVSFLAFGGSSPCVLPFLSFFFFFVHAMHIKPLLSYGRVANEKENSLAKRRPNLHQKINIIKNKKGGRKAREKEGGGNIRQIATVPHSLPSLYS